MSYPEAEIDRSRALELWVNEHSDYAKEQLILSNINIVRHVLKSLHIDMSDEDLLADGIEQLIIAADTFDPSKGFQFSTYAARVIKNEFLTSFRKKEIVPVISLDSTIDSGDSENDCFANAIPGNENVERDVIAGDIKKRMRKVLKNREYQILTMYFYEGLNQPEIAKILRTSRSNVSKIFNGALRKLRKEFGDY